MRCHASNGRVHARSQLILVADVPTDGFETLAAPHTALLSVKAEAPRLNLFSLPRIVVEVKPSPGGGGGLGDAPARVEFRLVRGGDKDAFHSFGGALDKTRERAVNRSRANPEDEFDLRECPLFCHTSEGARVFRWFRFFRCVCGCSGVWWPGTKLFFLDDDVGLRIRVMLLMRFSGALLDHDEAFLAFALVPLESSPDRAEPISRLFIGTYCWEGVTGSGDFDVITLCKDLIKSE